MIVQIAQRRALSTSPSKFRRSELGPVASNEMWDEIYERIAKLVQQHRSTLIFVNTRRLAERVGASSRGAAWAKMRSPRITAAFRATAAWPSEAKLKAGEIRALVATASLELGIDIGTVDLVCQIGSPRSIAVALQRVGRAGHWRGAIPKGRFFATTRDELIECARAGARHAQRRTRSPRDSRKRRSIFSRSKSWPPAPPKTGRKTIYSRSCAALIRIAISRASDFDEIVAMLSEGIAARRGRYGAYLHRDQVNHRLRGRRGSRLAAITSGGAIPDNALYTVVAEPEGSDGRHRR